MRSWISDIPNQFSGKELRKVLQKKRIVKYLYSKGDQTNAYLAQKLHISIPTVQTILNELISESLVTEKGLGDSSGGRRPNMYGLTNESFYTVGVDINRYATRVGIYNHKNENITGIRQFDVKLENRESLIDEIADFIKKVITESKLPENKIIGVGINMPGLIDSKKGINYTYLNFDNPVGKSFEDKLQIRVHLENDARARALAELRFGAAQGKQNVLVLHIDWGVGLGMILDGKLYRGISGFAGEFSHTTIQDEGELCHCGKHGCLETIASGMALSKRIQEGLKAGNQSMLTSIPGVDISQLKLETIIDTINRGDMFSISLISNMAHHLGKGIATLISILNPELVILGGRLSKAGEYLITPIKQSLYLHCIPKLREDVDITVSVFDVEAGVLGAIAVVTENTFN
jgi:N-acetylglucosamine repressor